MPHPISKLSPCSKALVALAATAFFSLEGLAKNADEIASEMKGLVESSLEEYRALEQAIASEKSPMVSRLSQLEEANLKLRSEAESYRFLSGRIAREIDELNAESRSLQSQTDYLQSAFEDFLVKFDSRINVSEGQRYFDQLEGIRAKAGEASPSLGERFRAYSEALDLSLQRTRKALGGDIFEGKAIDSQGRIHAGSVVVFGPTAYFASEDSARAGMLRYNPGAIEPGVTFIDGREGAALVDFIKSRRGEIPLDATLGDALALKTSKGSALSHIGKGGVVGYFIILLGTVATLVSLLKLRDLKGFSTPGPEEVSELARTAKDDRTQAALEKLRSIPGVAGEVLAAGVRNINKNALLLEETMLSVILRAKPKMERYLPFLAITAAASPLLGLLGTVVGLIKTFALITLYGAGAPNALSSGISEALVTTELGLIVAIPMLILHGLFSRVIRSRINVLEQIAFDFVETTNLETASAE